MNVIFLVIFCVCALGFLVLSPDGFLSALLSGASKSASLCLALLTTYAVWLGLMQVWEDSGLSRAVSKRLRPIAAKIFKTQDEQALNAVCMNLSVNLLGISGAATPYGIQAAALLDKTSRAEYASALLFLFNATSLQLFPTSIVAIMTSLHSANPTAIVLPILFSSLCSTLLAVSIFLLCNAFYRPIQRLFFEKSVFLKHKTRGAGTR